MLVDIRLGDCLEGLRSLPDESVDLWVTSPPYNLGEKFHSMGGPGRSIRLNHGDYGVYQDNMPEEEYQAWQLEVLKEMFRTLKPDGSVYYNHKTRIKNGRIIHPMEWLLRSPFVIKQEIVVDQRRTPNTDPIRFYPTASERVYWLTKHSRVKLLNKESAKHTNLWVIPTNAKRSSTGHPAAFNPELPRRCIEASSLPGMLVGDPFLGVGTTARVAVELGRNFIGWEIDPKYYKRAVESVNECVRVV